MESINYEIHCIKNVKGWTNRTGDDLIYDKTDRTPWRSITVNGLRVQDTESTRRTKTSLSTFT